MRLSIPAPVRKPRIEIIPLIDVMFFLLASFMMVSLTMQRLRTLNIDLPSATAARSNPKLDLLEVTIDRTGDLFVENRRYTLAEFKILLHNRVSANARLPVYVKPHRKTPHGVVVSLIDGIRAAGIQKISVAIGDEGLKQE